MKTKQQSGHKWLIALYVGAVVLGLLLLALSGGNGELLINLFRKDSNISVEELSEQLREFGWRGYVSVAALVVLQVLCTFLPAEPIQMLGGFAFGFPVGLLCCMAGVLFGATLIYMLQSIFGERLRHFFVKKLNLDLEAIAQSSKGGILILMLYYLPAVPYGMICFVAASMGMSYRRYLAVTLMGALPSVCIGVGLGHMVTEVSGWVTICVLTALVAVAVLIFWKRNALFEKINSIANKHKKTTGHKVQPVNMFVLNIVYFGVRLWMAISGVKIKTRNKVGAIQGPAIVLCNHGSFMDFIYAAALLRKMKPHFIVARLYFYHRILGYLLKKVGAFPKSMFAMDMENAKNCLTVLKNNEILAMMPEARLSTAGCFEDIQSNTYSFIKKSGVDVYAIKISGDYLADPKWGKGFRRGALVEAELEQLYTAQQLQELSLEQLQQGIEAKLSYDEFAWLSQRPNVRYTAPKMAEGLENILSVCPICGRKFTLTTKKKKIFCQHCGYLTSVDDRYAFDKDFQFQNLAQWYHWQKDLLEAEIGENPDYTLSSPVELRLPGEGKGLTRHGGKGVCTLSREGLTYAGTKDGETVELQFSLSKIYRLLFGAGENFELYDGAEILYFVPEEKRSAVQWYMASMILYDRGAS